MEEFQEQQLFQGATQSQGFDPIQAPDTSRYLRENMGRIDANFARIQNTQKAAMDAELRKQQDILQTLGQFSETAMKFANTVGKAYIDSEVLKGHTKARSLGKAMNYGIKPEKENQFNAAIADSKQDSKMFADVAVEYGEKGAPLEAVNYIKSLSSYQQIGATRAYLKNKGNLYKQYVTNFMQRDDIQLAGPGNTKFTPQQAGSDPVLMNIALAAASELFDAEEVGIGADYNPSDVAMKGLYEQKDKVDNEFMLVTQRNKSINDSANRVATATEIFAADRDLNGLLSEITGTVDANGRVRNRAQALDYIFAHLLDRYYAGDTEAINALDTNFIDGDEKGQTWRQRFKNRIEGVNGLNAKIADIDRKKLQQAETEKAALLKAREENFYEEVRNLPDGVRFTDEQIKAMKEDAMKETGMGPSAFRYMDDYITVEENDTEQESEELDELRRRRGYLIESDLRNKSSATYKKYISIVQQDTGIAKRPPRFVSDNEKLITALTNRAQQVKEGDKLRTPEWEDMARRARNAEAQYYAEEIRAGNSPEVAQANTIKRLKEAFKENLFAVEPEVKQDQKYLQKLRAARLAMSERPDLDQFVFANTEQELDQLSKYNQGQGEIPKLYYDLANGQKNVTAWDIAAAQFRAAGLGELGKSPKQVQFSRASDAVQRILRYKPTPNRVARVSTSSFRSQTSSLPDPAYKQAADAVAKYEDAGAGYNAVNQIGIKGGRGVYPGSFSGDFTKMEQHGGRPLTDHTLGEVLALGAGAQSSMSNEEWIKRGKIHAAGRYQFIHNTLKGLVQRHNLPSDLKFSPQVQDFLFLSLLSTGGLGQWVGPSDHATAQEREIINQAKSKLTPQKIEQLKNQLIGGQQ